MEQITAMGFTRGQAERAYKATNGNLATAVDWCLSHPDDGSGQALGGSGDKPPLGGEVRSVAVAVW